MKFNTGDIVQHKNTRRVGVLLYRSPDQRYPDYYVVFVFDESETDKDKIRPLKWFPGYAMWHEENIVRLMNAVAR